MSSNDMPRCNRVLRTALSRRRARCSVSHPYESPRCNRSCGRGTPTQGRLCSRLGMRGSAPRCATARSSGMAPAQRAVRLVPEDGQLSGTATDLTAHTQTHHGALALTRRDQRRQIQKDVTAARSAEDAQSIAVFVKRAQGIELDDHQRR